MLALTFLYIIPRSPATAIAPCKKETRSTSKLSRDRKARRRPTSQRLLDERVGNYSAGRERPPAGLFIWKRNLQKGDGFNAAYWSLPAWPDRLWDGWVLRRGRQESIVANIGDSGFDVRGDLRDSLMDAGLRSARQGDEGERPHRCDATTGGGAGVVRRGSNRRIGHWRPRSHAPTWPRRAARRARCRAPPRGGIPPDRHREPEGRARAPRRRRCRPGRRSRPGRRARIGPPSAALAARCEDWRGLAASHPRVTRRHPPRAQALMPRRPARCAPP